jgi:hypothetical protein
MIFVSSAATCDAGVVTGAVEPPAGHTAVVVVTAEVDVEVDAGLVDVVVEATVAGGAVVVVLDGVAFFAPLLHPTSTSTEQTSPTA